MSNARFRRYCFDCRDNTINFTDQKKKFCLNLHYSRVNSYIFVNGIEIYKFKAKDYQINAAPLSFKRLFH